MPHDEGLGSGLDLSEDWDLVVDTTGDIAASFGVEEVEKDMAMLTAIRLDQKVGDVISPTPDYNTRKDIELLVRRTLLSDSRIAEVIDVEVTIPDTVEDTIYIDAEVRAENDDFELHFPVR